METSPGLNELMYFDEQNSNPLHAKFLRENINIYLHFMSFLSTDKTGS